MHKGILVPVFNLNPLYKLVFGCLFFSDKYNEDRKDMGMDGTSKLQREATGHAQPSPWPSKPPGLTEPNANQSYIL